LQNLQALELFADKVCVSTVSKVVRTLVRRS